MIQPNEIRIGNYVYLQKSNTFYQITEITQSEVEDGRYEATGVSGDSIFHTFTDNINPIPLTEERLIKLGAEKYTPDNTYKLDGIIIDLKLGIAMLDCGQLNPLLGICKYIHQLQNIWFIRKNQELEIEL